LAKSIVFSWQPTTDELEEMHFIFIYYFVVVAAAVVVVVARRFFWRN
jgi:hypothetical protein